MSQPYWEYKDKVDYDYEFKVILPIKYKSETKFSESQKEQIAENISKGFDEDPVMLSDDYLKEAFPEIGVGRVYAGLNDVYDEIEMYFGISLIDAEPSVTLEDIKEDIKEYMNNINSNLEYDSNVVGLGDDEEPAFITFAPEIDKLKIEILKQPVKESYFENIDKVLVSKGELTFIKENMIKSLILSDDGMVELYENNKLISSNPFSKLGLIRECKNISQEGYVLNEAEISSDSTTIDVEKSKEELKKDIEQVDELQKLKDELDDKVDTLVNESKNTQAYLDLDKELDTLISSNATDKELDTFLEKAADNELITNSEYTELVNKAQNTRKIESNTDKNKFPSSEQTQKYLCCNDLKDISLRKDILNESQIDYIENNICSLDDFENGFKELWILIPVNENEPLISIDEYINCLQGEEDLYE